MASIDFIFKYVLVITDNIIYLLQTFRVHYVSANKRNNEPNN